MVLHNGPVIRAPAFYNNGSRYLSRIDQGVNLLNDQFLELGTDQDTVIVHRSTINNANTGITGVLVGTPVTPIIPANSTIISNVTEDTDILFAARKGDHSQAVFWADGSTGDTAIMAATGQSVDTYIAGSKQIDYSTGAMALDRKSVV